MTWSCPVMRGLVIQGMEIYFKMVEERKFKNCSVCGKKISWLRKLIASRWDKDPLHLIPLSQFCCNKCAAEGLQLIMAEIESG